MKKAPSKADIESVLRYDNGRFYWKISRGRCRQYRRAGSLFADGTRRIGLSGTQYTEAELSWVYHGNRVPEGNVRMSFKDGDKTNVKIENLEVLPDLCKPASGNEVTPKGVSYIRPQARYESTIIRNGTRYNLGRFIDLESAVAARVEAEDLLAQNLESELRGRLVSRGEASGVSFNRSLRKYEAQVNHNKVRYFLGRFTEEADAVSARQKAKETIRSGDLSDLEKFRVTRRPKRYCQRSRTDFCSHLSETGCELYGEFRDPYDYLVLRRCLPNCKCPYNIEK